MYDLKMEADQLILGPVTVVPGSTVLLNDGKVRFIDMVVLLNTRNSLLYWISHCVNKTPHNARTWRGTSTI